MDFDFRDWLRTWLFREESHKISSIMRQVLEQRDAIARSASLGADALVATVALEKFFNAKFVAMQSQYVPLLKTITEFRGAEEKRGHDLLKTQQETEQKIDRLLMLLEPQAARLRAGRPVPVKDWDEVQRNNLKQFEEPAR